MPADSVHVTRAVQVAEERLLTNLTPDKRREFKRILHTVGSQAVDVATPSCLSSNTGNDKTATT